LIGLSGGSDSDGTHRGSWAGLGGINVGISCCNHRWDAQPRESVDGIVDSLRETCAEGKGNHDHPVGVCLQMKKKTKRWEKFY